MASKDAVVSLPGVPGEEETSKSQPEKQTKEVGNKPANEALATQKEKSTKQEPKKDGKELDWRAKVDTSKMTPKERALLGNMTYEEETEHRKNTSIGAIISGLSSGNYGKKAKDNVVVVEGQGKRGRYNQNWQPRKRFQYDNFGFGGGFGGGNFGGGNFGGGNFGGGNFSGGNFGGGNFGGNNFGGGWDNWNSYDSQYQEEYEEEEPEDNTEWMKEETKLLDEEFGEGVITLMDDEEHDIMYVCEICASQMNARRSVLAHVNGAKHLKKKNNWDKKRRLEALQKEREEKNKDDKNPDDKAASESPGVGQNSPFSAPPATTYGIPGQWGAICAAPPPSITPAPAPAPAPAPTPAPTVEEKPKVKTSLSGGATGTLLQKLAACAVKNFKDSDLASNVVMALIKAMKEFSHNKGDTKAIEILTEIDVRLRGLKAQMPSAASEAEKKKSSAKKETSKGATKTEPTIKSSYETTTKADPSKNSGLSFYPSDATQLSDGSGTWYSQAKGTHGAPSAQTSLGPKGAPQMPFGSYSADDSTKTSFSTGTKSTSDYISNYSSYPPQTQYEAKDTGGYSFKPPNKYDTPPPSFNTYNASQPNPVIDIIHSTTAPPPPPPPENAQHLAMQNYVGAGYPAYYSAPGTGTGTPASYGF